MRRCLGCFEQVNEAMGTCPYCGYVEGSPVQNKLFLVPGTLLSGRYTIGKALSSDRTNTFYVAWDNSSNIKVKIREYLPVDCVTRDPETNAIAAYNASSKAVFDKGFAQFVEEAKRIFTQGGNVKLYDCVAENNTAYMIMEYKEEKKPMVGAFKAQQSRAQQAPAQRPAQRPAAQNQPAASKKEDSNPAITVIKSEKKENRGYEIKRKFSLIPIWIKIVVPLVIVVGVVLGILISKGVFKKPEETEVTETEVSESTEITESIEETEETTVVSLLKVKSFSFAGHSYAYYDEAESWEAAKEFCESMDGHLVTITSKEENDAVWAFANTVGNQSVFLGLSDANQEGKWEWVTGEYFSYSNWTEGEPNAYTEAENYAEFAFNSETGTWNDFKFDTHAGVPKTGFICEWEYDLSNPVSEEPLTSDEALKAFQYHVAKDLVTDDLAKSTYVDDDSTYEYTASWKQLREGDNISIYSYLKTTGECIIYYTDMYTGVTTSLKYSDSSCDLILSIGEYDYNAFECQFDINKIISDSQATELKSYMHENIYDAAEKIGNLSDGDNPYAIEFESDDMFISTTNATYSEDIRYMQIRGTSGNYSLYGVTPGMLWEDAIVMIAFSGAETAERVDSETFNVTYEDGTTVTLSTIYDSRIVSHVAATRD